MRKKSLMDEMTGSASAFDKSLGLDRYSFPEINESSFGQGFMAKKSKQKPRKTNVFVKRNNVIYSGGEPKNFKEADQHDYIKNTDMFNFNLAGRIKQQQ